MPESTIPQAGASVLAAPKSLLHRPKLAALIGTIVAEWSYIEQSLAYIFNVAAAGKPSPIGGHSIDPIASAIFDTLVGFPARISVVKSVIKLRASDELKNEFNALHNKMLKRSKERNTIAHACWNISDQYPDDLVTFDIDGSWIIYTEKDLSDILERTVEIRNQVNDFSVRFGNSEKKQVL